MCDSPISYVWLTWHGPFFNVSVWISVLAAWADGAAITKPTIAVPKAVASMDFTGLSSGRTYGGQPNTCEVFAFHFWSGRRGPQAPRFRT